MTDNTQAELELQQKIFEMTVLTGQKFMKTKVLEDWTLSTDIMSLVTEWHNKQVEAVLDRLDKETERCQDGCWVSIKAERERLGK